MTELQRDELVGKLLSLARRKDVRADAPMREYTTLRLGGAADVLMEISSVDQLRDVILITRDMGVPVTVLGNGSNLLCLDGGVEGLVVHLGDSFSDISEAVLLEDGLYSITAQAGARLTALSQAAAEASLCGLEFAAGIPGTVGGAVLMNAGAYGGEMKNVVSSALVMDKSGQTREMSWDELKFDYRYSSLQASGDIVLSATVRLKLGDRDAIETAMREFNARRRDKQPLTVPSCGSTFKRPQGGFAGPLIEESGLKGLRVGGASVSEKHAGFLVNDEGGTAKDFLTLIEQVQKTVLEKTGVALEPEVRIIGRGTDEDADEAAQQG